MTASKMKEEQRTGSRVSRFLELMKGIDGNKWACKTENCHKSCDSHPCLIEKGMRSREEEQ